MSKSKLLKLQVILLTFIVSPVAIFASQKTYDRSMFLRDPYLPFYEYESKAIMLADFDSRFAETYERIDEEEFIEIVQSLVDEVYLGFKKLYPKFMSNKSKPLFVIAKSDDGMDLTAYMPRQHNDAHKGLMIFTTGFVNSSTPRDVKLGLVAHEMSHLFFWHLDSNTNPVRVNYAKGNSITEAEVEMFMSWFLMADIVGWVSQEEMNGLTIDGQIWSGVSDLITKLINIETENCGDSLYNDLMGPMIKLQTEYMDRLSWGFHPKDEERSKINSETRAIIELIKTCLATQPAAINKIEISSYVRRVLKHSGVEHDDLTSKSGEDTDNIKTLTFSEYIDLSKRAQAKMREFAQGFDYSRLRYYSSEDQADETAVTVIKSMGYRPNAYAEGFLQYLGADVQTQCKAIVDGGSEPPYGDLVDNHHAPCWRYYHLLKVSKKMDRVPGLE